MAFRVSIWLQRSKFRIRHFGCDDKPRMMRPEFFLLFFSRGGTAGHEFTELHASRLAHLQLGPATKDGGRVDTGEEEEGSKSRPLLHRYYKPHRF